MLQRNELLACHGCCAAAYTSGRGGAEVSGKDVSNCNCPRGDDLADGPSLQKRINKVALCLFSPGLSSGWLPDLLAAS